MGCCSWTADLVLSASQGRIGNLSGPLGSGSDNKTSIPGCGHVSCMLLTDHAYAFVTDHACTVWNTEPVRHMLYV